MKTINKPIAVFEDFVFQRMSASGMFGLSIALVKDDELFYQKGFGFRDFNSGLSATPRTTYCIGSVTKTFTALSIMQLYEKGLLSLDDPVDKYLPLKLSALGEPVLVKHLMSHTSGLSALGYAEATLSAISNMEDSWLPICSPDDLIVFMQGSEEWAVSKPGSRYAYLNEGYILLGKIIEAVSNTSYIDYVQKNIFEPLSMKRSTFSEKVIESDDDVATPYVTSSSGERTPTRYPFGQMVSDGGIMSNALEMSRYIRAVMGEGELEGMRVASPDSVRDMITPKIRTEEEPYDGVSFNHYGLGLRIRSNFFNGNLVYHSGSVFGSSGYMGLMPSENIGVVILASGGYFLEDIGEYALALMINKNPKEIPYFKRVKALEDLTGTYKTFRNTANYKLVRSGGILQLETSYVGRTYTTPLIPVDLYGQTKMFRVYGVESWSPVIFTENNGIVQMVYERNLARRVNGI